MLSLVVVLPLIFQHDQIISVFISALIQVSFLLPWLLSDHFVCYSLSSADSCYFSDTTTYPKLLNGISSYFQSAIFYMFAYVLITCDTLSILSLWTPGIDLDREALLRYNFNLFDENRDGKIDLNELDQVFLALRKNLSTTELDRIRRAVNRDGTGSLNYEEFVAVICPNK